MSVRVWYSLCLCVTVVRLGVRVRHLFRDGRGVSESVSVRESPLLSQTELSVRDRHGQTRIYLPESACLPVCLSVGVILPAGRKSAGIN